ncbi:MAG: AraC family transcriptional regulator [Phycisphaeraceae bacterium]|nr:AraC family transcriptional regulator [Phycisphaeraceae bacterium]
MTLSCLKGLCEGTLMRPVTISRPGQVVMAGLHLHIRRPPGPMRYWDTYALVYALEGRAAYTDQSGLSRLLTPGDALLTFPGHGYVYNPDEQTDWSELWIVYAGAIFDAWRGAGVLQPANPIYRLLPIDTWLHRMLSLVSPSSVPDVQADCRRVCRLQELLVDIVHAGGVGAAGEDDQRWLDRVMAQLNAVPLHRRISLGKLAAEMNLSLDRYRKRFAALTGITPSRHLFRRQIDLACELLPTTGLPLKRIARQCGFCDEFHFSARFKAAMGVSPSQYRQLRLCRPR